MILAPHSFALTPTLLGTKKTTSGNNEPHELQDDNSNSVASSLASIPQLDALDLGDAVRQQASLSVYTHARTELRDGDPVRVDAQTKLRFQYEFEAADGTKIEIRLRVNSKFSQVDNGTDEAQSLKIRAKLKVNVVQEQVNSGVAPLLEDGNAGAGAGDVIAKALELFQQLTDSAASAFDNSDSLDGDSLIANLVDAFNGLASTILSSFLGLPDANSTDDPTAAGDPAGIEAAPGEALLPAIDSGAPPADSTAPPTDVESTPAQDPIAETPVESEPSAAPEQTPEQPVPEATQLEQDQQPLGQVVMIKLRLQVIQSLKDLAGVFNRSSDDATDTNSALSPNAYAQYYSQQLSVNLIAQLGSSWDASI